MVATKVRKPPRQARARTTVDAILEASQRVFADSGFEGTTTRIAHVAGVSIGSLYQYFPGKESIFGALVARAVDEDIARIEAALVGTRGQPADARMRAMVEAALVLPRAHPRFFSFLVTHVPALGQHAEVRRLEAALVRMVGQLLREHPELGVDDEGLVAVASVGALRGLVDHVARQKPEHLGGDVLLDVCMRLVRGYFAPPRT